MGRAFRVLVTAVLVLASALPVSAQTWIGDPPRGPGQYWLVPQPEEVPFDPMKFDVPLPEERPEPRIWFVTPEQLKRMEEHPPVDTPASEQFFESPASEQPVVPEPPSTPTTSAKPSAENEQNESQGTKAQWELWHRRVSEAIYVRFDALASKAFATSRPIACQAVYTVTRDRQIINVRLVQRSSNVVFNSMLLLVLKSMNGNPILEFPPGSRRLSVEKEGTFSRNYGVGDFDFPSQEQEVRDLLHERSNTKQKNKKHSRD